MEEKAALDQEERSQLLAASTNRNLHLKSNFNTPISLSYVRNKPSQKELFCSVYPWTFALCLLPHQLFFNVPRLRDLLTVGTIFQKCTWLFKYTTLCACQCGMQLSLMFQISDCLAESFNVLIKWRSYDVKVCMMWGREYLVENLVLHVSHLISFSRKLRKALGMIA